MVSRSVIWSMNATLFWLSPSLFNRQCNADNGVRNGFWIWEHTGGLIPPTNCPYSENIKQKRLVKKTSVELSS